MALSARDFSAWRDQLGEALAALQRAAPPTVSDRRWLETMKSALQDIRQEAELVVEELTRNEQEVIRRLQRDLTRGPEA